ncbi:TPA: hypothetical protein P9G65_005909 [Pseudomonas aeruginosa]|nr:hypothetical protein [Pseudomonas aeruginosa]HDQ4722510.1 hypothetical protein [Pseudomonas aeruginosa]HDQ4723595.1 hypothetical protein [Pseudomonas aeruginosa]
MKYCNARTTSCCSHDSCAAPILEADVIQAAQQVAMKRFMIGRSLAQPKQITTWLQRMLELHDDDTIVLLLLNEEEIVFATRELFRRNRKGSICSRELCKAVIEHNAAAVIIAHKNLTHSLKDIEERKIVIENTARSLHLTGCRMLDYIIVNTEACFALAEEKFRID